jgi:putative iron-dependent peroxidase
VTAHPQPGIFALGTVEHSYVELDLLPDADPAALVTALAALSGPATTVAGVNVVIGIRPELWASLTGTPAAARSFTEVEGVEGYRLPATQHDAWLWIAAGSRAAVFDATVAALRALAPWARVATELNGWLYQHQRDLTGFIDGTENPSMVEAPDVAAAADGSSVLLFQQWQHLDSWRDLAAQEQEQIIGRTKDDSTELSEELMPADSHVARNVIEVDGEELAIYRRNTAYGGATEHGTVFVGFCAEQGPLAMMLDRMAGVGDGVRDALTRYTVALTGAYYLVPSVGALAEFLPPEDADQAVPV